MLKISELIIVLLIALIPFIATNLTYDPTIIKTTLIKAGIIILLSLYLINSLRKKEISIKKISPVFFIILLAGYVTLNFIFKYPIASTEALVAALLFFCFFLSLPTSPLLLASSD